MILLLTIIMLIELAVSVLLFHKKVIAPAVAYSFSFSVCAISAAIFSHRWELDLHWNTFLVISGGGAIFIICCYATDRIIKKIAGDSVTGNHIHRNRSYFSDKERLSDWKLYVFLIVALSAVIFSIYEEMVMTGESTIQDAIYQFDQMSKFSGRNMIFSKPVWLLRVFTDAVGYWSIYTLVKCISSRRHVSALLISLIIASAACSGVTGSRGGIVNYIMTFLCSWALINYRKRNLKLTVKGSIIISAVAVILLVLFRFTAIALGRSTSGNLFEYFATYCGAQIKNLDIYLQSGEINRGISTSQTFINIVTWLGPKFGLISEVYKLDLPFQSINGFNLGNVYTAYYAYIYDFGYVGCIVLTAIMAVISQSVYTISVIGVRGNNRTSLSELVYVYMFSFILFSYFSNKFYENVFTSYFIYLIVSWIGIMLFLTGWDRAMIRLKKTRE